MNHRKISFFSLTLLIVSAIASIRTLPSTAFFGSTLVFFYLLATIIFLIPVAFVSAEFSSRYPEEGGIFHWTRHAFGNKAGLFAVWLQWINTMVWYPTTLLFIAGTASYLIDPALANNKLFLFSFSISVFWALTIFNLRGIQASVRLNAFCGVVGILIPMSLLILLGGYWVLTHDPLEISFSAKDLVPSYHLIDNSNALITIMASFLGIELAGVHIADIENPQRNFPKAVGYSVLILIGSLVFGALAIAFVIPQNDLHFVDGVMQTFTTFLNAFHMPYFTPILALLIILGATGGSINWLLSPAQGLVQAAEAGFLPKFFLVKNQHNTSSTVLLLQASLVTLFCGALCFISNVNTYYWFLMSLSTGLYMLMYIILFLAALKLKRPKAGYQIPRGMRSVACFAGLGSCALTMVLGFQPAPGTNIESGFQYVAMIVAGFTLMLAPVALLWRYQEIRGKHKELKCL